MAGVRYPKGEIVWMNYLNKKGETVFILTSKPTRDTYFLYELVDGVFKKLGRAKNPMALEEKFRVKERMEKP